MERREGDGMKEVVGGEKECRASRSLKYRQSGPSKRPTNARASASQNNNGDK